MAAAKAAGAGSASAAAGAGAGAVVATAAAGAGGVGEDASAAPVVSIASIAKGEVWFAKNMVLPFWDAIAAVYPPLQRHAQRTSEAVDKYGELAAAAAYVG